jgi:hypothetical protein
LVPLHKVLFTDLLEKIIVSNDNCLYDSPFTLVEEYLNLEKDIDNANQKTKDLLIKSRNDYILDLKNLISVSPFLKYKNIYYSDLKTIVSLLTQNELDYHLLKMVLDTFLKKRKINYFKNIQNILDENSRVDFKEITILVDYVLQEIKSHNFSIEKIKSTLKYCEDKTKVCLDIQKVFDDHVEKEYPLCLLKIHVPAELEDKNEIYVNEQVLYKVFNSEWELVQNQFTSSFGEDLQEFFITKGNYKKYSGNSNLYLFNSEGFEGADYQTKIRKMVQSINRQLMWVTSRGDGRKRGIVHNTAFTFLREDPTDFRVFNVSVPIPKSRSLEKHESDIEEFYNEYIIALHKNKNEIDSFKVIYNLLNLIENTTEMTLENQLVILWSCLEKICVDLNKNTIISKVLSICSRAHLMYVLKQDLNEIWNSITLNEFHINLDVFKDVVIDENGKLKYKPADLLEILINMEDEDKDIIMGRDISLVAKIHCLVENTKSVENIKKYLELEEQRVGQNIRRIYRHRNILTHTNLYQNINIDYFVWKLKGYLFSLISIIIHYTLRNPLLTIKDIIYSIDKTYEYYVENIISTNDFNEILKPHYLYL